MKKENLNSHNWSSLKKKEKKPTIEKPVNVQCEKCKFWGWVGWFNKTETGYECLGGCE